LKGKRRGKEEGRGSGSGGRREGKLEGSGSKSLTHLEGVVRDEEVK